MRTFVCFLQILFDTKHATFMHCTHYLLRWISPSRINVWQRPPSSVQRKSESQKVATNNLNPISASDDKSRRSTKRVGCCWWGGINLHFAARAFFLSATRIATQTRRLWVSDRRNPTWAPPADLLLSMSAQYHRNPIVLGRTLHGNTCALVYPFHGVKQKYDIHFVFRRVWRF